MNLLRRLNNLWRLSNYEAIDSKEPLRGDSTFVHTLRPSKKAQIIKKENKIDEFLKS